MVYLLGTNVLVAAFATRGICRDVFRTVLAEHRLLVGESVLVEFERILTDKLRTPPPRAREIVAFLREHGDVVAPDTPASWPENGPDDRWIVAAAQDGSADVLVNGDSGILLAGGAEGFQVLTPGDSGNRSGTVPPGPRRT